MKTVLIAAAIFGSSLLNNSYANRTIDMKEKLQEVVTFENGTLPVAQNKSEFVKVSFKINEAGRVEVLEMNYSDEIIKSQLMEKLSEIKIEEEVDTEEVYNYNFTFKKI